MSNSVFTNTENMDKAVQFLFIKKSRNISCSPIKYLPGRFEKTLFSHAEVDAVNNMKKSTWFNQTMCPFLSKFTMLQQQKGSFTVPAGPLSHFWSIEMTNRLHSGRTCRGKKRAENTLEGNKP